MAIQVNGTTVINDSRALTNIASVDATTVAALGAAGVGAAWSLISETAFTSNVSNVSVTFPSGYLEYVVEFPRLYGSSSGVFSPDLRFYDGSGNLITADQRYHSGTSALNSSGEAAHDVDGGFYTGSSKTSAIRLHFFNNPRSSSTKTMLLSWSNGYTYQFKWGFNAMRDPEATNGFLLYPRYGPTSLITTASHDYKIWGLK